MVPALHSCSRVEHCELKAHILTTRQISSMHTPSTLSHPLDPQSKKIPVRSGRDYRGERRGASITVSFSHDGEEREEEDLLGPNPWSPASSRVSSQVP